MVSTNNVQTYTFFYKQFNVFRQVFGCLIWKTISGLKLLRRLLQIKRLLKSSEEKSCLFVSERKVFHSQSEYSISYNDTFRL